ncbi:hypothetical protein QLQ12_27555 [Actinoplanes sp. NEAU-A12]|uniref:Uncharacterized protein n=1 Tax=Actinoplanes sandaracinus TaxID=3045177 RepID=A0ABT6WRS4_9ACTN|nr:hypothetical protein [Actinoplanes sandaracinus]MDI6102381.1 hypothetical protein [Actinoplanes sandaracinus]
MSRSRSRSAPHRRTHGTVLLSLAVLGLVGAAFAGRRPLLMSAPRCMAGRWQGCFDTENGVLFMMPGPGTGVVPGRLSLIPLRDLVTMGPVGVVGNLLIFAALGFFAPMRFAAWASVPRIVALGAGPVCTPR